MYSRLLVPLLCTEIQPGLVLFSLFPLNFGSRHLKFLLRMISCCCSCIAPMALFSFALVGFFTSKSYKRHKSQYYQLHLDGCGSCVLPQYVSKTHCHKQANALDKQGNSCRQIVDDPQTHPRHYQFLLVYWKVATCISTQIYATPKLVFHIFAFLAICYDPLSLFIRLKLSNDFSF